MLSSRLWRMASDDAGTDARAVTTGAVTLELGFVFLIEDEFLNERSMDAGTTLGRTDPLAKFAW
jgi:hypothetical protein